MVGQLSDKVWKYGGYAPAPEPAPSSPADREIRIDLTAEQLDALLGQWSEADRNVPARLVVTVGSQPVGVFHVIASHLADPAELGPPGPD